MAACLTNERVHSILSGACSGRVNLPEHLLTSRFQRLVNVFVGTAGMSSGALLPGAIRGGGCARAVPFEEYSNEL